jgi:hypothetical protein
VIALVLFLWRRKALLARIREVAGAGSR